MNNLNSDIKNTSLAEMSRKGIELALNSMTKEGDSSYHIVAVNLREVDDDGGEIEVCALISNRFFTVYEKINFVDVLTNNSDTIGSLFSRIEKESTKA